MNSAAVGYTEQIDADVLELDPNGPDVDIEPDERMQRVLIYDVEANQGYHLKATPEHAGVAGKNHYVPIRVAWPT